MTRPRIGVTVRTIVGSITAIACAAFVLAACGQAQQSRQAASPAPAGEAASPASAADPAAESQPAGGAIRGSRICIVNNTTSTYAIDVKWTKQQSFDRQGPIIGGVTACGQGYDSTKVTNWGDVAADVLAPNPQLRMLVAANNPAVGPPELRLYQQQSTDGTSVILGCFYSKDAVGETRTWDDGVLKYTATRLNDSSNYKEWRLRIDISSSGSPKACSLALPQKDPNIKLI